MIPAKRLLVVEDETKMRNGLRELFTDEGFSVETAKDGLVAIDRLNEKPYDLVLADLKMPRLDGMGLLERTTELRPTTVFIVITGYGSINSAVQAMKLGAADYVTKPFDVEQLLTSVKNALESLKAASSIAVAPAPSVKEVVKEKEAAPAKKVKPGKYFPPHFWEGCFIYTCGVDTCPFTADCFAAQGAHQRKTEKFIESVNQMLLDGRVLSATQQAELDHAEKHHGAQFDSKRKIYVINKAALKNRPGLGGSLFR